MSTYARALAAISLAALTCACSPDPDSVIVELAPDVISSEDATVHAAVLAVADGLPISGKTVTVTVTYVDQLGTEHAIEGGSGETDDAGRFDAVLTGLLWGGSGVITAEAVGGATSEATFTVLDLTPPRVTILPPTSDLVVGAGFPMEVPVDVEDELGVTEVIVEASGDLDDSESTVVASGAMAAVIAFDFDVPNNANEGPTITLYALAKDLAGNIGVAEPVVLTVDASLTITTPMGLDANNLLDGDQTFLEDPTALAISPMDGQLYVADNAGNAPCNGGCIRLVNPSTAAVAAAPVIVGQGTIEGLAFDATGDNLFYSDRNDRVSRLTWDGAAYTNPVDCNNPGNNNPADPAHLIVDPTLGVLVVDQDTKLVKRLAACDGSDPTDLTAAVFENPWGITAGAADEMYVSDEDRDRVFRVDQAGATTPFEGQDLDGPRGLAWVAGSSAFADSLLVANHDGRDVLSTQGGGVNRNVAFLRNNPVAIALDGGTLYLMTAQSAGDPGRIFTVTGF